MYIPAGFSATNGCRSRQTLAIAQGFDIGDLQVWQFSDSGFGTKYSLGANNVSSNHYGQYVTWNTPGTAIAFSHEQSPYAQVFPWTFSGGTGTKYSNPTGLNSHSRGIGFNRTNATISVGTNGGPSTFPWSDSTGWGTKYSAPASQPTGTGFDVEFINDGTVVAHSYSTNPGVHVYNWTDGTGYGTKYSDPSGVSGGSEGCKWNYLGNHLAVVNDNSPYIYVWPFTKGTGFGTKYSNPGTTAASLGRGAAWSQSSRTLFYAATGSGDFMSAYPFTLSVGFGTKYTAAANTPSALAGIGINRFGDLVAAAVQSSPYISVHKFNDNGGWGTKFSNPASLPVRGLNSANWI